MRIGILGTGMVGKAIGTKLVSLGHEVRMGSRQKGNPAALEWVSSAGARASEGNFDETAAFGEMIFVCAKGDVVTDIIRSLNPESVREKIVVSVSNPLDFSKGMPPTLIVKLSNTTSLAEEIQRLIPDARVVNTLNTMNCEVMVASDLVKERSDVFVCGNDAAAKAQVIQILQAFGWAKPIDLGDLTAARATEMLMPIWLRLWGQLGTPHFNFRVAQ